MRRDKKETLRTAIPRRVNFTLGLDTWSVVPLDGDRCEYIVVTRDGCRGHSGTAMPHLLNRRPLSSSTLKADAKTKKKQEEKKNRAILRHLYMAHKVCKSGNS